jgi:hypothetical protein
MTDERLPDGPDLDEMLQLIRDAFPDAVVATIDSAAFFSLDEDHWPNFATVVWTDEHDEGAPSNLARPGVYRVNVGVDRETFRRLISALTDPDYAAFDRFVPHPVCEAALDLDPQPEPRDCPRQPHAADRRGISPPGGSKGRVT